MGLAIYVDSGMVVAHTHFLWCNEQGEQRGSGASAEDRDKPSNATSYTHGQILRGRRQDVAALNRWEEAARHVRVEDVFRCHDGINIGLHRKHARQDEENHNQVFHKLNCSININWFAITIIV